MRIRSRIIALLAITLAAPLVWGDEAELKQVQEKVSERFPEIHAEHVFPGPLDGWYTIRKGAIIAYVSGDGRYLMQGDMIDLDEEVNLTERSRNEARRSLMSSYPEEQMIVFSPEEKRFSVAVFTDIDCTFCRRLHNQMDEYLAAGIEVRYLLYPRNGPTSPSWAKAEDVWCAADRNQALTAAKSDRDFDTRECNPEIISTHYSMGQDVGLRGTPALVFPDGSLISGYLTPSQMVEALASMEP